MLARCLSASLQGLEARPVVVEVDLPPVLPGVQLVGLPDKAIQESRERVRSGLSSRSRLQLLRVARTIADLNDTTSVYRNAVAEASCFRCRDLLKPGAQ